MEMKELLEQQLKRVALKEMKYLLVQRSGFRMQVMKQQRLHIFQQPTQQKA